MEVIEDWLGLELYCFRWSTKHPVDLWVGYLISYFDTEIQNFRKLC